MNFLKFETASLFLMLRHENKFYAVNLDNGVICNAHKLFVCVIYAYTYCIMFYFQVLVFFFSIIITMSSIIIMSSENFNKAKEKNMG